MKTSTWVTWSAALLALGCGNDKLDESVARETAPLVAPANLGGFAVLASGHVTVQDRSVIAGGHVGVAPGSGDSLTAGFGASVALGRATLAQRAVLKDRSALGDLFATSVSGPLATYTSLSPYAVPPVPPPIAAFTAGSTPVTVSAPTTLAAGNYGLVSVNSTLTLSGGTYQIQNLSLGNYATVQASAPVVLRVAGRVSGGNSDRILPTGSQPASALRIFVAGPTDTAGGVVLGTDASVTALVVSQASFQAGDRFVGSGAIAARNVTLGFDARLAFAGGFECAADAACDDGNGCTGDACVDARCVHTPLANGTACADDGNGCTTDVCSNGACAHPAVPNGSSCASDGNACTTDQCTAGQCTHPALPDGTGCADDGNVCTSDTCAAGTCAHPALTDGTACTDDANACTTDACSGGACTHASVAGCALVGPGGGTVRTPDDGVVLTIPPGALATTTKIDIRAAPAQNAYPYSGLLSGAFYDFAPSGLSFAVPATVSVKYDPTKLPAAVDPSRLVILSPASTGGALGVLSEWVERPSSVDVASHTVTGTIEHFSPGGVGQPVTRITVDPPLVALIPETSMAVNVFLFGADGSRLLHTIDWTSDAPALVSAHAASGLDQALIESLTNGSGDVNVTATVHNDTDPDASVTIPVKLGLATLSFQNAVSSGSADTVNDDKTIGYSYSADLSTGVEFGALRPASHPMTATFSAFTYRGQELTVIDGPFYGFGDDDQGGVNALGPFSSTHGWSFVPGLKFSTMHLEPGDQKSMTYDHVTGHVMRYVRGTCSQRIPWSQLFQGLSDATESGLVCATQSAAGFVDVTRRYFRAQPQFRSEVRFADTNQAPVKAGFFIEAQYDVRVPVINAGVTVGVNPGFAITRSSDGLVATQLLDDAPNVQVVNDSFGVTGTVRDKLRTQIPQLFARTINQALTQPLPFDVSCDPDPTNAASAAQTCLDGTTTALQVFCDAKLLPEACLGKQVLTPSNFACSSAGKCLVHPTVVAVNVLPEELELVFGPDPERPEAQIDRFFRAIGGLTGAALCAPLPAPGTRLSQPVAALELAQKTVGSDPPVPCR